MMGYICRSYVQRINQVCTRNVHTHYQMCIIVLIIDCTDLRVYTDVIAYEGVTIWAVQIFQLRFCAPLYGVLE